MLISVSSKQHKTIAAKNRKTAGMRMALRDYYERPATGALSPGLLFENAVKPACCP